MPIDARSARAEPGAALITPRSTVAEPNRDAPGVIAAVDSAGEEDRVSLVRALVRIAVFPGAVGLGLAGPVDRAGRGRRGARWRRRVLPGPPLRPAAGVAVPAAGGDRGAHQADRDRHRRDRHALREPPVHGRGRRRRGPHRRWPPPARHQPRLARAGRRRVPLLRLRAGGGEDRRRHGPRAHRGLPPGPHRRRVRPAQPQSDVSQPTGPAPPGAALARPARADLVGRRHPRHRASGPRSRA